MPWRGLPEVPALVDHAFEGVSFLEWTHINTLHVLDDGLQVALLFVHRADVGEDRRLFEFALEGEKLIGPPPALA